MSTGTESEGRGESFIWFAGRNWGEGVPHSDDKTRGRGLARVGCYNVVVVADGEVAASSIAWGPGAIHGGEGNGGGEWRAALARSIDRLDMDLTGDYSAEVADLGWRLERRHSDGEGPERGVCLHCEIFIQGRDLGDVLQEISDLLRRVGKA